MLINQYKCGDCKAEFEGLGGGNICPACNGENLNKTGSREIPTEEFGCGGGCGSCGGCQ